MGLSSFQPSVLSCPVGRAAITLPRYGRTEQYQAMVEPHWPQMTGGIEAGSATGATVAKPKAISTRQRNSLRDILKLGLRQP
jgi:hypothetical protein